MYNMNSLWSLVLQKILGRRTGGKVLLISPLADFRKLHQFHNPIQIVSTGYYYSTWVTNGLKIRDIINIINDFPLYNYYNSPGSSSLSPPPQTYRRQPTGLIPGGSTQTSL